MIRFDSPIADSLPLIPSCEIQEFFEQRFQNCQNTLQSICRAVALFPESGGMEIHLSAICRGRSYPDTCPQHNPERVLESFLPGAGKKLLARSQFVQLWDLFNSNFSLSSFFLRKIKGKMAPQNFFRRCAAVIFFIFFSFLQATPKKDFPLVFGATWLLSEEKV